MLQFFEMSCNQVRSLFRLNIDSFENIKKSEKKYLLPALQPERLELDFIGVNFTI